MPDPVVKTSDGLIEKICQGLRPVDEEVQGPGGISAPVGASPMSPQKGSWCLQFNYENPEWLTMMVTVEAAIPLPIQIQLRSEMDYFLVEKLREWLASIPIKKGGGVEGQL